MEEELPLFFLAPRCAAKSFQTTDKGEISTATKKRIEILATIGTNTVHITIGVEQIRSVEECSYCGNLVIIDNSSTEVKIEVRTRKASRNMNMCVKIWSNKNIVRELKLKQCNSIVMLLVFNLAEVWPETTAPE